eukprot:9380500-Ditylum_brightwellii.AAC.1
MRHKVISISRTSITYTHSSEQVTNKPEGGSLITDLHHCAQHLESTPTRGIVKIAEKLRAPPTTFREYIQTLATWEQHLLKHVKEAHTSYRSLKHTYYWRIQYGVSQMED